MPFSYGSLYSSDKKPLEDGDCKENTEAKDSPTSSVSNSSDADCANWALINCILDAIGVEVSIGFDLCYVVFIHFEYLRAGLAAQTAANTKLPIYFWLSHNASSFMCVVCFFEV